MIINAIKSNKKNISFLGNINKSELNIITKEQPIKDEVQLSKQAEKVSKKTNTKKLVGAGLALLAIVGGIIAFVKTKAAKKTTPKQQPPQTNTTQPPTPDYDKEKIEAFYKKNVSDSVSALSEKVQNLHKEFEKEFLIPSYTQFNPRWDKVKEVPNVLAPFESKNDFSLYEIKVLAPQILSQRKNTIITELLKHPKYYRLKTRTHHGGLHEAGLQKGLSSEEKFKANEIEKKQFNTQ